MILENTVKDIEKQILDSFYKLIFMDLVEELEKANQQLSLNNILVNSAQDERILKQALRSGKIQYADGIFSGSFTASISHALRSIGARFDQRTNQFKMEVVDVPIWVRTEASIYQSLAKEIHGSIIHSLNVSSKNVIEIVDQINIDAVETLKQEENKLLSFSKRFLPAAVFASLLAGGTKDFIESEAEKYAVNIKLPIKNFAQSQIDSLRKMVQDNAEKGYRFDRLVSIIEDKFEVSRNKAKFLSLQETSLFVSKMKEERYKQSGIDQYKWSSSKDEKVRDDHRKLDGNIYSFANPPIVDSSTGRRANPGEDFNCRCVAIPIVKTLVEV